MPTTSAQRLFRWQQITLGTLLVGYVGYYLCRSNLSIAQPSILAEFGPAGWDKKTLGTIISVGTIVYALGKITNGYLADVFSSRRMFLAGMLGSALCTIAFGLGNSFGVFLVAWSFNRFVQSAGWGALVKLASRWFPVERHGLVMAILCLSYLPGDGLARIFLSFTLAQFEQAGSPAAGDGVIPWRGMFFVAAAVLVLLTFASWLLLKDSPRDVDAEEPRPNPKNVYGDVAAASAPVGLVAVLAPLLRSGSFWLVLYMSLGLTLVRETFNSWTPTYLHEACGLSRSQAGMSSAIVPMIGGISAIAAGLMADRLAQRGRGVIMFASLTCMSLALGLLARVPAGSEAWIPLTYMCAAYFFLIGPYTFLTGVISLDFGGKRGAATAAGLTDAAGYLGGALSGRWIGGIAQDQGWTPAFAVLAVSGFLTAAAALAYWLWHDMRAFRARPRL